MITKAGGITVWWPTGTFDFLHLSWCKRPVFGLHLRLESFAHTNNRMVNLSLNYARLWVRIDAKYIPPVFYGR